RCGDPRSVGRFIGDPLGRRVEAGGPCGPRGPAGPAGAVGGPWPGRRRPPAGPPKAPRPGPRPPLPGPAPSPPPGRPPRARGGGGRGGGGGGGGGLGGMGVVPGGGGAFDRRYERPDWRVVASALGARAPTGGRAILIQHYTDLLPLSLYLPGLRAWPAGGAAT